MDNFTQILAYSTGAILLGVVLTMYLLLALTQRNGHMDGSEGCLGTFILLFMLGIAVGFFGLAVYL